MRNTGGREHTRTDGQNSALSLLQSAMKSHRTDVRTDVRTHRTESISAALSGSGTALCREGRGSGRSRSDNKRVILHKATHNTVRTRVLNCSFDLLTSLAGLHLAKCVLPVAKGHMVCVSSSYQNGWQINWGMWDKFVRTFFISFLCFSFLQSWIVSVRNFRLFLRPITESV